jgi:hypothetical protein
MKKPEATLREVIDAKLKMYFGMATRHGWEEVMKELVEQNVIASVELGRLAVSDVRRPK